MLPLLHCEDVCSAFCAVTVREALRTSAPYRKNTSFETLCVLGRCDAACRSLRTSKSLQRAINMVRKQLVVQLARHPSFAFQRRETDSSSLWNLVKAGDISDVRQYLAAGFLVSRTRLIHCHSSQRQALPREFSGLHCAWMTQASPCIMRLLLLSGINPDVNIMPGDAKFYYSATELKRECFLREHPLRPSAMTQAGAMSLSNELPMHLCLSLCAQGSHIHVIDKDRGSIGMIQCQPQGTVATPSTPATQTDFLSSSGAEDANNQAVCVPRSKLDVGRGVVLNSGGGRAQLPPALDEKLEALLAKNCYGLRAQMQWHLEHGGDEETKERQESSEGPIPDDVQALMDEIEAGSPSSHAA